MVPSLHLLRLLLVHGALDMVTTLDWVYLFLPDVEGLCHAKGFVVDE